MLCGGQKPADRPLTFFLWQNCDRILSLVNFPQRPRRLWSRTLDQGHMTTKAVPDWCVPRCMCVLLDPLNHRGDAGAH